MDDNVLERRARTARPKSPYDAQATFALTKEQKRLALSLLNGKDLRYEGDVYRLALSLLFDKMGVAKEAKA